MQNRTTLARPYARAAFGVANNAGHVNEWSQALQVAAAASENETVLAMIGDPRLTTKSVVGRLMEIGGEYFDKEFERFLDALAHYDRLTLLADVYEQFEALRRESQARVYIHVTSAEPVSEEQSKTLSERLKKRFGRDIDLEVEVDPALIGGAIIRAGDEVIDGSIRGRLERLTRDIAS